MTSNDSPTKQAATFDELSLGILLEQMKRAHSPKFIATCAAALVAFHSAPWSMSMAWLTFFGGSQAFRFFGARWYWTHHHQSIKRPFQFAVTLIAWESLGLALCCLRFPWLALPERAALTVIFVSICAGAVTTTGANKNIFFAFSLPLIVPLSLVWAIYGRNPIWLGPLFGFFGPVFIAYLYGRSREMHRILRESFSIRQERAELNRELQAALLAAEAASRAKTRFLASASHDLRQPIQTLSLFSTALAMRPLDERSRSIASNINMALHDLTSELDALLDTSKLDAGLVPVQASKFQVSSLLDRVGKLFDGAAKEKQLRLRILCPPDAWTTTDRVHLDRIVRNLVENAVKYTDVGGIDIEVTRTTAHWELSIADTGCGIATDEQTQIFEEFYQVNNPERDRKRGLGLGLSIVKRLTAILDIPLALSSTPNVGTRFALTLAVAEPDIQLTRPPQPDQSIGLLHILVIDDEESVRLGMKALLEELNCTVSLGASTEEAIAHARINAPDILLTDLRLRGTDNGIEAIRAVRQIIPDLPALIITGDSAPEKLLETQAAGVAVIHKPVSSKALLAEISRLTTEGDIAI